MTTTKFSNIYLRSLVFLKIIPIAQKLNDLIDDVDIINDNISNLQSVSNTITASATQTQVGGTVLTATYNRVTVAVTAGDSLLAPVAAAGATLAVYNHSGAEDVDLYPQVGTAFYAGGSSVGTNTAITIPDGEGVLFTCFTAGVWVKCAIHTIA